MLPDVVGSARRTVLAVLLIAGALGATATGLEVADRAEVSRTLQAHRTETVRCTLFASPTGSDADGTGSASRPFRTPQRLVAALPAGGTGCLRSGRYSGDVRMQRDGTTLRSARGARAVLDLDTLEVPEHVLDVTISHLDLVGGAGEVTVRAVGDGVTLLRNDITNRRTGATCVLIGASDHPTLGARVVENVVHGCGRYGNHLDHGIYAQNVGPAAGPGALGLLVEGNVLYDVASYAVQLYPRSQGAVIRDNVIDGGGRSVRGGVVLDGELSEDHRIEGNAIARTRSGAVVQRTGTGHVSRGNCLWGNARGIAGPSIRSAGDRSGDACWLSEQVWRATGAAAAAEPCVCPDRLTARCGKDRGDVLCRLLKRSKEEM